MYKVVDLKQGTDEWLLWRKSHITASDIPSLFNASPYKTAKTLFEEKIGIHHEKITQYQQMLFDKGHYAEKIGREHLSKIYNKPFNPAVVESLEVEGLGASLDGFEPSIDLISEFKYIGPKSLKEMIKGNLKKHHILQIQAQLGITGMSECIYFCMDGEEHCVINIKPDQELIKEIKKRASDFIKEVRLFK